MVKFCEAQDEFIQKVRKSIEFQPNKYFDDKDWMNISPAPVGVNNSRNKMDMNKLLTASCIGIHRAERLLYAFFEESNGRKGYLRLGQTNHGTHHTEILINMKSAVMLRDHYDRVHEKQKIGLIVRADDPHMQQFNDQIRRSRNQLLLQQEPFETAPTQYPTGISAVGNPMAVNPSIVAGALLNRPPNERITGAPWKTKPREKRQREEATTTGVFRSRMFCTTCGFPKSKHIKDLECKNKPWTCLRTYCARCGWNKEHHVGGIMGPNCCTTAPTKADCPTNWYTDKQCSITVVRKCKYTCCLKLLLLPLLCLCH